MFFSTKHFIQLLDKLFLHCPSKNTTKIMPQNCGQKELSFTVGSLIWFKHILFFLKLILPILSMYLTVGLLGCYVDRRYRTLGGAFRRSNHMTIIKCVDFCKKRKFRFAGVEVISNPRIRVYGLIWIYFIMQIYIYVNFIYHGCYPTYARHY